MSKKLTEVFKLLEFLEAFREKLQGTIVLDYVDGYGGQGVYTNSRKDRATVSKVASSEGGGKDKDGKESKDKDSKGSKDNSKDSKQA